MSRMVFVLSICTLAACGGGVDAVCAKQAECFEKDCDYTDEACNELAKGVQEECRAESHSYVNAVRTGEAKLCDACADAFDELMNCMASIDSCAAFDSATDVDGDCFEEARDLQSSCEDAEQVCLE